MEQDNQSILTRGQLENFFLNQNIQIDFGNFFVAIILSLVLSFLVKLTYLKVGRALNDKDYFLRHLYSIDLANIVHLLHCKSHIKKRFLQEEVNNLQKKPKKGKTKTN